MKHKIKYKFYSVLYFFFGGKFLQQKKILAGILLLGLTSSCTNVVRPTCYDVVNPETLNGEDDSSNIINTKLDSTKKEPTLRPTCYAAPIENVLPETKSDTIK